MSDSQSAIEALGYGEGQAGDFMDEQRGRGVGRPPAPTQVVRPGDSARTPATRRPGEAGAAEAPGGDQATPAGDDPFGLPPLPDMPGGEDAAGVGVPPGWQPPNGGTLYTEDDLAAAAGMDSASIARLQRKLRGAGLLEPPYRKGVFDQSTRQAYVAVLTRANSAGESVERAIDHHAWATLREGPGAGLDMPQRQEFVAPVFRPPDPAQLAQDVKALWQQRLGREPTDGEMERFTQALGGAVREQFDADVAAARQEHERGEDARIAGAVAEQGGGGIQGDVPIDPAFRGAMIGRDAGGAQAPAPQGGDEEIAEVDAGARLMEQFEDEMGPEEERIERRDEAGEGMSHAAAVFSSGARIMGG